MEVGIEACASSHYWSRELQALGHTVGLMPPTYVKPYVKRQKNDMADAEAICEAVTRTNMRFVPTKTPEQQSGLMLHRTRHLLIRQQTSVINTRFALTLPNLASLDRDLIHGQHYGQRSCEPHSKAEHMAVPTQACYVSFSLPKAKMLRTAPSRRS